MMTKYHNHADVKAHDEAGPQKKRQRKGRMATRKAEGGDDAQNAGDEDKLRIGYRKRKAIQEILKHCTTEGLAALRRHLVSVGGYKKSAVSDELFNEPAFWPDSAPSEEYQAQGLQVMVADFGAAAAERNLPPGCATGELSYDAPLSSQQFLMVIEKAIHIFEDSLTEQGAYAIKMGADEWRRHRFVIQAWDGCVGRVLQSDLASEDYAEFEKAILFGDALDEQIVSCLRRRPRIFHTGMIPDVRGTLTHSVDDEEAALSRAELQKWEGSLSVLSINLRSDWAIILKTQAGSLALPDMLLHSLQTFRFTHCAFTGRSPQDPPKSNPGLAQSNPGPFQSNPGPSEMELHISCRMQASPKRTPALANRTPALPKWWSSPPQSNPGSPRSNPGPPQSNPGFAQSKPGP